MKKTNPRSLFTCQCPMPPTPNPSQEGHAQCEHAQFPRKLSAISYQLCCSVPLAQS
ncbi:MAG: hypothetical protein F6J93_38035 [Oscillatoria sp. SIO1A7]|nr:hypothetical protein [Oscillatoria sp. SIO1A7]